MTSSSYEHRFFIDTNIIVYSFDKASPKKRKKSLELVGEGLSSGKGIISHQVIQEFVSVVSGKFADMFDTERLVLYLDEVLFSLWKAYPDRDSYLTALQLKQELEISWWDALVVASALASDCKILYTEDLQHNQRIRTLQVVNPFL